jgi:hypothetical protein
VTRKYVVLILVLFGIYSGYKWLSVSLVKSEMKHAVESVLDDVSHETTDKSIKARLLRRAASASLPVSEGNIKIRRESRTGERILHIDIEYPVTIDYLGSARTLESDLHVTKVVRVNEAAEARRAERLRREEERREKYQEFAGEYSRKLEPLWKECEEKHGKGNCRLEAWPGGGSGEIVKMY